ncbi:MAG: FAD-dependent oxidoreductase, partial [Cetobacterium sp.]
ITKGLLTERDAKYFQGFTVPNKIGAFYLNCPELDSNIDVMDGFQVSQQMIEGRQTIKRYIQFFKKMFPGFENAHISQIANFVGIRESIRIKGEYLLSKNDVISCKKQKDSIARCNWYMDIHGLSKEEQSELEEEQKMAKLLPINERYYDIPYRSLYSKKVKNLLVVGRCISVDFEAQSSMRIQPVCRALGEAAGYASKIALDSNKKIIDVTGEEIQKKMIKNGANF